MNTKTLKDNLAVLKCATAERVIQPILGNIYFNNRMMATNLDFWAIVNDDTGVNTTASFSRLEKMINAVKTPNIELRAFDINSTLQFKAGALKTTVRTLPASEFPVPPKCVIRQSALFNFSEFIKETARVVKSAASYDANNILDGVSIKLIRGIGSAYKFEIAATDGSRMVVCDIMPLNLISEGFECVIPASALENIVRSIGKKDIGTIRLDIDTKDHWAHAVADKYEFYFKLLDGRYPQYRQLIPDIRNLDYHFQVDKKELLEAIKTVKPFANERTNIMKFAFRNDTLGLTTQTPDIGDCEFVIRENSGTGRSCDMAFNYRFIEDAVKLCNGDSITVSANSGLSPCLFTSEEDPGYTAMVMPVQIK